MAKAGAAGAWGGADEQRNRSGAFQLRCEGRMGASAQENEDALEDALLEAAGIRSIIQPPCVLQGATGPLLTRSRSPAVRREARSKPLTALQPQWPPYVKCRCAPFHVKGETETENQSRKGVA